MEWNRQDAWELLTEWTENESLRNHALGVEAAMREYAKHFGENEEKWGITGLLHDLDYEKHPTLEEHPRVGVAVLRDKGYPEDMLQAILGHGNHTGVPRETLMAKTLYAVDELVGLVVAVALVRPSKSVKDVKVKSVKKKLKDKAFARGVNREDIEQGVEELDVELNDHIAMVIKALQNVADTIGL